MFRALLTLGCFKVFHEFKSISPNRESLCWAEWIRPELDLPKSSGYPGLLRCFGSIGFIGFLTCRCRLRFCLSRCFFSPFRSFHFFLRRLLRLLGRPQPGPELGLPESGEQPRPPEQLSTLRPQSDAGIVLPVSLCADTDADTFTSAATNHCRRQIKVQMQSSKVSCGRDSNPLISPIVDQSAVFRFI